ncbi:MAG TPA: hypothetical protein PK801_06415, partial [Aggregatilineales bacterium]|nr:hypothetical protein [Aggregatilineales bacterium]HQE20072.1 hypothetical protein [Aggregatilineales bacterium]
LRSHLAAPHLRNIWQRAQGIVKQGSQGALQGTISDYRGKEKWSILVRVLEGVTGVKATKSINNIIYSSLHGP